MIKRFIKMFDKRKRRRDLRNAIAEAVATFIAATVVEVLCAFAKVLFSHVRKTFRQRSTKEVVDYIRSKAVSWDEPL